MPYSATTGRRADSTNPATWTTHDAAVAAVGGYDGVGYVFSAEDPYLGVDLDGCVDERGEIHPAALDVVTRLGGYRETTPSGRGLHVIVTGTLTGDRHRTAKTGWGGIFEIYDRARFFTVTGHGMGHIREAQAEVDALYQEMFPPVAETPPSNGHAQVDDHELLRRAFEAANGSKIRALYGGSAEDRWSPSEADLALCGHLAFWTGPDPSRVDRLFRSSGLMRDKWDSRRGESTYGRQTVDRALAGRTEFYDQDRRPGNSRNGDRPDTENHAAGADQPTANKPILTRANAVRSRRVRWAWKGYMPLGYLTIQTGETKLGKSTFVARVIAQTTTGALPGELEGQPMTVLILAVEDSREDLWKPRLDAAGADLDRVEFLNIPDGWNVRDGVALIEAGLAECAAPMVFIDSVMEHLPDPEKGESSNSTAFVRRALRPLAGLCENRRAAGLISTHPPKGKADSFTGAYHGSGAFTQLSRSCLLFGWHPDDRDLADEDRRRVMLRAAANIGRDPGAQDRHVGRR